jgi:hypothetical protein
LPDKTRLFATIGSANMKRELEKHTRSIVEKHQLELKEKTGIESSFSEYDITKYVEEAMSQVKIQKENLTPNNEDISSIKEGHDNLLKD